MQKSKSKNYAMSEDDYKVIKEMSKRLNCTSNLVYKKLHDLIICVCGIDGLDSLLRVEFKMSPSKDRSRYVDFSFLKEDSMYYRRQYYNLAILLNDDEFEKAYSVYMLKDDSAKLIEYFLKKL